jgi:hypothetical protein
MRWLFIPVLILLWCFPANSQNVTKGGPIHSLTTIPNGLVAALPPCNGGTNGAVMVVTNALTPVVGSIVVTGGAVTVLIHCNGTNWVVA